MDVFGRGTDEPSRPLLNPAICFICENSPQQDAMRVIDTHREFNPEVRTRLSGRKYICEPCAEQMGEAMGLVKRAEFEKVVDELRDTALARERLEHTLEVERESKLRVVVADEVADVVSETVRAELAKRGSDAA